MNDQLNPTEAGSDSYGFDPELLKKSAEAWGSPPEPNGPEVAIAADYIYRAQRNQLTPEEAEALKAYWASPDYTEPSFGEFDDEKELKDVKPDPERWIEQFYALLKKDMPDWDQEQWSEQEVEDWIAMQRIGSELDGVAFDETPSRLMVARMRGEITDEQLDEAMIAHLHEAFGQ